MELLPGSSRPVPPVAPTRTSALALSILAECVRHGGPTPFEYPQASSALSVLSIDRVPPEQVASVLAPTLTVDCLHGWGYLQPHGVPGDHAIVERILNRQVSRDPRIAAWDEFLQAQPGARALRNRTRYFEALLQQLVTRRPVGASVLVIGSGSAVEVHGYLSAHPEARLQVTCVEGNAEAVALATARCASLRQPVQMIQHDPATVRLRTSYDLIWMPALGACLEDREWVGLASRLIDKVTAGGDLVIGSLARGNPSRPYLEVMLRWFLIHRSADALASLAHQVVGREAMVRVESEPESCYLFVRVPAAV